MDDDDLAESIRAIRETNRLYPCGGYWAWVDKPVREREAIRDILTALGWKLVDLREGHDPPDCEALVNGERCGIEATELIDQKARERNVRAKRARKAGKVPPEPSHKPPPKSDVEAYRLWMSEFEAYRHWQQTEGPAHRDWSRKDFLEAVQQRIDRKDEPKDLKGGPYQRYILVIYTNEYLLVPHGIEQFLAGATFKATMITDVVLGLPPLPSGEAQDPNVDPEISHPLVWHFTRDTVPSGESGHTLDRNGPLRDEPRLSAVNPAAIASRSR